VAGTLPTPSEPVTLFFIISWLHHILKRRRVPHYTFEVLRTRQRYFDFLATPDATLSFDLGLRPAMRLSLAANYAAGVFIRDSQGVSSKKDRILLGLVKTILYSLYNMRRSCRQVRLRTKEIMTPLDALSASPLVAFAPRSFEGIKTGRQRYVSLIFRRGRGVKKISSD